MDKISDIEKLIDEWEQKTIQQEHEHSDLKNSGKVEYIMKNNKIKHLYVQLLLHIVKELSKLNTTLETKLDK